ncbi:MAG: exodeoxyribonuclease V subunit beta [Myxococcota bacterium]
MTPLDVASVPLSGTQVIEASAGTGKTHTIVELYLRLLEEQRLPVDQILVVTYTRAATAELRARIRSRLREALESAPSPALVAALRDFDRAPILTIHGFCQRVLSDYAFESEVGFDLSLLPDQGPLLLDLVRDFWVRALYRAPTRLVHHLQKQRFDPDALVSLARKAVQDPSMPILPASEEVDLAPVIERFEMAHEQAARIWRSDRDDVLAILSTHGALNRQSYRSATVHKRWAPMLDEGFREADHVLFSAASKRIRFELLTARGMRAKRGTQPPRHRFFEAAGALHQASNDLEAILDQRLRALQREAVDFARSELPKRKARQNLQSYDDLLHRLREALAKDGSGLGASLRRSYRAALIDEFQDTDPVQFEIFHRVWGGTDAPVFFIGDPKQAIYAFRGADVFAYMRAVREAATRTHTLQTNWRSDPRLIHAVNRVFGRAHDPFLFSEIEFRPVEPRPDARDLYDGAPLRIVFVRRDEDSSPTGKQIPKGWPEFPDRVAALVAEELARPQALGGNLVRPEDIAVLCRTNRQAYAIQDSLRELGIAAVMDGDQSVFDSDEAVDVERLLLAMIHPSDPRAVRAALASPALGVGADQLSTLGEDEAWDRWLASFMRWHDLWRGQGFVQAFRRFLEERSVYRRLLSLPDGERRITNLLHLGELLHEASVRDHLGPNALLRWLRQMRNDEAARAGLASEATQIRLESDAHAVQLTTVHKSKGLQYPIVFCPFLFDGSLLRGRDAQEVRYHDPEDDYRLKLDLGKNPIAVDRAELEALSENLRLLYVAMTRAQHACIVFWGAFRESESSPLAYLLHQPKHEASGPLLFDEVRKRLKGADDDALLMDLRRLAMSADGAIGLEDLAAPGATGPRPVATDTPVGPARRATRELARQFRSASFSSLTSDDEAGERDYGEVFAEAPGRFDDPTKDVVTLAEFPAGPGPGQALHEILEHWDFRDDAQLRELAKDALQRFGVAPIHLDVACRGLREVVAHPLALPSGRCRLLDLEVGDRLNELEFTMPVTGENGELTPARLAAVFARHDAPPDLRGRRYAQALAELQFADLRGHLRGFIDLCFVHDGRWYIVDYKSNFLGAEASHYAPRELAAPMREHHYILQYHLYSLALHRYLRARQPGYRFQDHFGGVAYLFLRGMSAGAPSEAGVYFDRPSEVLIDDLSRLMGTARSSSRSTGEDAR